MEIDEIFQSQLFQVHVTLPLKRMEEERGREKITNPDKIRDKHQLMKTFAREKTHTNQKIRSTQNVHPHTHANKQTNTMFTSLLELLKAFPYL